MEKEEILVEMQGLHQSTNGALSHLQLENKQLVLDIGELNKNLEKAEQELVALISSHDKDQVLIRSTTKTLNIFMK